MYAVQYEWGDDNVDTNDHLSGLKEDVLIATSQKLTSHVLCMSVHAHTCTCSAT